MEIKLTNDAEYLLCELYSAYKMRRKNGVSSFDAKLFGDPEVLQEELCPTWPTGDIEEAARELSRAGLVKCLFANDTFSCLALDSSGVALMEHHFADKLDKLASRISTLRSILFG